jgi:hypothetical protein
MAASTPIEELLAEARRRRHQYDLHRAKARDPRTATMSRLQELERAYQRAEARLRRAQQEGAPHSRDGRLTA